MTFVRMNLVCKGNTSPIGAYHRLERHLNPFVTVNKLDSFFKLSFFIFEIDRLTSPIIACLWVIGGCKKSRQFKD